MESAQRELVRAVALSNAASTFAAAAAQAAKRAIQPHAVSAGSPRKEAGAYGAVDTSDVVLERHLPGLPRALAVGVSFADEHDAAHLDQPPRGAVAPHTPPHDAHEPTGGAAGAVQFGPLGLEPTRPSRESATARKRTHRGRRVTSGGAARAYASPAASDDVVTPTKLQGRARMRRDTPSPQVIEDMQMSPRRKTRGVALDSVWEADERAAGELPVSTGTPQGMSRKSTRNTRSTAPDWLRNSPEHPARSKSRSTRTGVSVSSIIAARRAAKKLATDRKAMRSLGISEEHVQLDRALLRLGLSDSEIREALSSSGCCHCVPVARRVRLTPHRHSHAHRWPTGKPPRAQLAAQVPRKGVTELTTGAGPEGARTRDARCVFPATLGRRRHTTGPHRVRGGHGGRAQPHKEDGSAAEEHASPEPEPGHAAAAQRLASRLHHEA